VTRRGGGEELGGYGELGVYFNSNDGLIERSDALLL